ncbi:PREDICTED: NADH dehydrogenase [ubiquinone] 1 beta subcomplex subunit 3-like [Branchiostoma belcheri]|uniref:NADH dehydrogenase [ubiquinone] 1 beta subcomplex subunit 3 n=1 Tax=Branchiostoma belcheri TaxID=7741 RepID=A0A6P4ZTP5_BRABE|nr:PREDICTED: NADH dehydrogenase [ubiquinone] 1 beta subcomplex subunit 3-like [Branchiostoma belcheri]
MGGDGHGPPKELKIPDWRVYKIEGTPLEDVQRRLHAKGLHDPWLRNEAWRFTHLPRITFPMIAFRGFKYGFAAFVVALAVEKAFFRSDDHGHH